MAEHRLLKEADLPLDVVILLVAGMAMLIAGVLLFPVSTGALPYYEDGLYGLILVIFSLQTITLGRTPFGDLPRSKLLLAGGSAIAAAGIVTCFVPEFLGQAPRILLFLCFGPGGFFLLLQMSLDKDKLRLWSRYGGVFRHLILACTLVYVLSMLIALLIWRARVLTVPMTATVVLVYGTAIVYLAAVLRTVYRSYPEAQRPYRADAELTTDQSMLLLMGIFMLLLGVLLVPVTFGTLPFSGSAQLGLLMVIFAVQMLASGSTPIGSFRRSRLMILFGLLFAALGIVSCIIPDILVLPLTVLVGVLNILSGLIALLKVGVPFLKKAAVPRSPIPPVLVRLLAAQTVMGLLAITFGTSMLVSQLIPGVVIGVILAANGCVLLYLLHLLVGLDRQQSESSTPAV
jgi:hypothetical protein